MGLLTLEEQDVNGCTGLEPVWRSCGLVITCQALTSHGDDFGADADTRSHLPSIFVVALCTIAAFIAALMLRQILLRKRLNFSICPSCAFSKVGRSHYAPFTSPHFHIICVFNVTDLISLHVWQWHDFLPITSNTWQKPFSSPYERVYLSSSFFP